MSCIHGDLLYLNAEITDLFKDVFKDTRRQEKNLKKFWCIVNVLTCVVERF